MKEAERKINNKVLQLGSLNDELKQTNAEIERKHIEIEEKTIEMESLCLQIRECKKEQELKNFTRRNISEELRHKEAIDALVAMTKKKQDDLDSILNFLIKLENKRNRVHEEVKELDIKKKELSRVKKEISSLVVKQNKVDSLNKDITKLARKIPGLQDDVKKEEDNLAIAKKNIIEEKKKHELIVKKAEGRIAKELTKITGTIDALAIREADINIVTKRLKKAWPKGKPFPKI